MKKLILCLLILCIGARLFGQNSVNNYKYIIVPKKFDFQNKENQYRLNTYTKYLFEKEGFNAIYDDERKEDLHVNPCLGLKVKMKNDSGLFTTKMRIVLENCRGEKIFVSEVGKSKTKEYDNAYREAIERAFLSVQKIDYQYTPFEENDTVLIPLQQGDTHVSVESSTSISLRNNTTLNNNDKPDVTLVKSESIFYAQPTKNGFQLVDSSSKVVYKLIRTTQPDYFLLEEAKGVVYKEKEQWIAEYYKDDVLQREVLQIQF